MSDPANESRVILEDEVPEDAPAAFNEKAAGKRHDRITRRWMAFLIVGAFLLFYALSLLAVLGHWINNDTYAIVTAALAGPSTLAAAVVGFYYAKSESS